VTERKGILARFARERAEDRAAGRAERGLLTGRGRRRARFDAVDEALEDDLAEELADDDELADERRAAPRTGARRTVLAAIRHLPSYLRLLLGLMGDRRVSRLDRFLVLAAAAYIVSPIDFVPDLIPFLGEIDDLFLLVLALQRLIDNAGRRVLLDHWRGDPAALSSQSLASLVSAAGFFLPQRMKRRLRRIARR
jgi:uncharacterized membrane protein YkvA (DUF1232 family)